MRGLVALAVALSAGARAAVPSPSRVVDGHVHLTNTTLLEYLWGNASAGTCPCAPPCLCSWTIPQWRSASSSLAPSRLVFVEVDVNHSQWLAEATWVQGLAASPGGEVIGAIVAQPPPGFGTAAVSDQQMAAALDEFAALPLVHGVRPGIGWGALNETTFAPLLAHTRLLAERHLSFDINAALGDAGVAQWVTRLVRESPPGAQFVLDHLGGPPCLGSAGQVAAWQAGLTQLAEGGGPSVAVKVGGLIQCYKSSGELPTAAALAPFVTFSLGAFGFERSFFEANWFFTDWYSPPLLDVYSAWAADLTAILGGLVPAPSQRDVDALYFGTVSRVYRVAAPPAAAPRAH